MDNNLLISNILRLKRKLKIKVSKEIQGLELFEALQLEVRSLKIVTTTSPSLVELGAITLAGFATLISMTAFYTGFTFDTSYYFSATKDGGIPVSVGLATYLIKNSLDAKSFIVISVIYFVGVICLLFAGIFLMKQSRLSKRMKELEILDFYLGAYLDSGDRNKNDSYPNINDSYSRVDK
ncbi:hypothetical protein ACIQXF_03270 [Lysinibacillus sp. NPDC097231]|uniref:hypothetical protein n=1 Tax=Lysinibacillus sp. NPDC097231 TaxID=3364142 RepID=UPI0037FCAF7A